MPPKNWQNDPEYVKLMNFLIEKTRDAESPVSVLQLAQEFKEKSGASQVIQTLYYRITSFRGRIHQLDSIDTVTKVRMLVALGGSVDENFLNELRNDADVEVDGENRITKYRSKDGSVELEGDHCKSAKNRDVWKQRKMGSQVDSTPKTPGSTKRSAPEVPSSSKRTRTGKVKSEDSAPDDSAGIPPREPKPTNPGIQLQPKLEEAPEESGAHIPREIPIKTESEAISTHTSQIKFLEAIQSLVLFLGISQSEIHQKIQQKIQKIDGSTKIQNNEVTLSLELLLARIVNHSVPNLLKNEESVSLSHFLCYLKAAILNSKLEGLEVLLEKIEENIREPESKDKNIPVEKVVSALQTTLDVIGF